MVGETVLRSMALMPRAWSGFCFSSCIEQEARQARLEQERHELALGKRHALGERAQEVLDDGRRVLRAGASLPRAAMARARRTTALFGCGMEPWPGSPRATSSNQQMPFSDTCTG